jgi:hypothetical protein
VPIQGHVRAHIPTASSRACFMLLYILFILFILRYILYPHCLFKSMLYALEEAMLLKRQWDITMLLKRQWDIKYM